MVIKVTNDDTTHPNNVRGDGAKGPIRRALVRQGVTRKGKPCTRVTLGGDKHRGGLIWFGDLEARNTVELPRSASRQAKRWDQGDDSSFQFEVDNGFD
jgi:hypothetical protein